MGLEHFFCRTLSKRSHFFDLDGRNYQNILVVFEGDKFYTMETKRIPHSMDERQFREFNAFARIQIVPLLERYNFIEMIKQVIDIPTHEGYSLEEFCMTLL